MQSKNKNPIFLPELWLAGLVLINILPVLFGFIAHMIYGFTFYNGFILCYELYGVIIFAFVITFLIVFCISKQ